MEAYFYQTRGSGSARCRRDDSSNLKEYENVVRGLELGKSEGLLTGASVILARDNTIMEGCLYKGKSTRKKLFDLVVRLKNLEVKYGFQIVIN